MMLFTETNGEVREGVRILFEHVKISLSMRK